MWALRQRTSRTRVGAVQVIFTVIGAIPLFGQYPSYYFLLGALLVSLSVGMYGTKPEQSAAFYAACAEACREPTWLLELRTSDSVQRIKARCGMLQEPRRYRSAAQHSTSM